MEKKIPIGFYTLYFVGLLFFLEIIIFFFSVPEYLFPPPSKVFIYMWDHFSLFRVHIKITLIEVFVGIFFSFFIGIFLGGLFLYFNLFERIVFPFVFILQVVPLAAISPLLVLWLGFSVWAKIWVVFIFALYPIVSFFKKGLENIDKEMLSMATLMKAHSWDIFWKILFPFCFWNALFGLKIAVTYSLTSAIVAEFLGSSEGLGLLLLRALSSYNSLVIFSTVYIIIMISAFLYFVTYLLEQSLQGRGLIKGGTI